MKSVSLLIGWWLALLLLPSEGPKLGLSLDLDLLRPIPAVSHLPAAVIGHPIDDFLPDDPGAGRGLLAASLEDDEDPSEDLGVETGAWHGSLWWLEGWDEPCPIKSQPGHSMSLRDTCPLRC